MSPIPRIKRGRGSRHTGTSAPVARAACMRRGSSSAMRFARASSRNAAAASAEPPPKPGGDRQPFRQHETAELQAIDPLGERARRLEHEIVSDVACGRRGRPAHRQPQVATRRERQRIAERAKATRLSMS